MHAKLKAGDWVQVRSKEEILSTLDANGRLDSMPFMPEMFRFCGNRFQVSARAHKTCDPVNGLGARGMNSMVHLVGLRCDGSAHDGCQAGCLFYWKEAWLKPVSANSDASKYTAMYSSPGECTSPSVAAAERVVLENTKKQSESSSGSEGPTYVCQATKVWDASYSLKWWDIRHYIEDITSRNVSLSRVIGALIFTVYTTVAESGFGFGYPMRKLYDFFQQLRGGPPYPLRRGRVPKGAKTPSGKLDLQPGETVRMKPYPEILETLDQEAKNRGLYFDAEMVPFCTGTFKVLRRVTQIIHEKTGKMLTFKTPAIILEGVESQARYAKYRKFCPRAYYQYAREIWLEREKESVKEVVGK